MPGNNCFSRWAYNGFMKYKQNIKQSYLIEGWEDVEYLNIEQTPVQRDEVLFKKGINNSRNL